MHAEMVPKKKPVASPPPLAQLTFSQTDRRQRRRRHNLRDLSLGVFDAAD